MQGLGASCRKYVTFQGFSVILVMNLLGDWCHWKNLKIHYLIFKSQRSLSLIVGLLNFIWIFFQFSGRGPVRCSGGKNGEG